MGSEAMVVERSRERNERATRRKSRGAEVAVYEDRGGHGY
jgi:hypothetical protein